MKSLFYLTVLMSLSICAKAQFNNNVTLYGGGTDTNYIEIPASSALTFTSDVTVEARVRLTQSNANGFVFINCIKPDSWGIYLRVYNGAAIGAVVSASGTNYLVLTSTALSLNTWHHLAVVRSGTTLILYVDGTQAATSTISSSTLRGNSSSVSRIGTAQGVSANQFLIGQVDEVRLWKVARTATQISSNLSAELAANDTSNLVGYFKLNESGAGAGITVANSAPATGSSINGITRGTSTTPVFTTPLPLKLVSFSAEPASGSVRLAWNTAWETGTDQFIVERSSDAIQYIAIATQKAHGTSTIDNPYAVTDNQPLPGAAYYRLKMLDANGSFTYSKVVKVNNDVTTSYPTLIYQPVGSTLRLQGSEHIKSLSITDIDGRMLRQYTPSANNSYDVSNLSPGMYSVRLQYAGSVTVLKMIKL